MSYQHNPHDKCHIIKFNNFFFPQKSGNKKGVDPNCECKILIEQRQDNKDKETL